MANAVRVRVELQNKHRDPHRNFKDMMQKFRRHVSDAGIIADYKAHQFFESKSEKARKKRNEAKAKAKEALVEEKILSGEKVKAPAGLIKKVMASHYKKKKGKGKQKNE